MTIEEADSLALRVELLYSTVTVTTGSPLILEAATAIRTLAREVRRLSKPRPKKAVWVLAKDELPEIGRTVTVNTYLRDFYGETTGVRRAFRSTGTHPDHGIVWPDARASFPCYVFHVIAWKRE